MLPLTHATPGVYWEQSVSSPAPEFLTGVPVLIGFATKGDVARPQLLTLWTQFVEIFGIAGTSDLPDAVQGFFGNGGRACYVVRLRDFISIEAALAEALEAIAVLDGVDLVCAPDLATSSQDTAQLLPMQEALLDYCQEMGDRFAILDTHRNATIDDVVEQQQQLSSHPGSHNSALYFPWIQVQHLNTSLPKLIPPCGHIAGIYAQSDLDVGVHKAPANFVINGAVDLSLLLSDAERQKLNLNNQDNQVGKINCLRILPGRGIRVWGARTLSQDAAWRYVNVRRLFLMVGRWIDRNLTNFTFEPNDIMLWIRIERELTAYLETLLAQGALQGNSPQEAFYIKCDAETNPPEVRDRGMVITEIGLAPTVPSEFIVVRLIQGETGVTLV
ncbi:MAG: hypothetical protein N4J56_006440 [Chroococcidiopsis sp. SAG 2025]|uniref:phage tail sheath family protein n=1 Tax=Chroococcidiopsis sp. SAG 2025 TaxID=171389 RepID=UPI0029371BE1|nr:phage tail sheath subtilisin-like domain-containing protein [Chroococcidiopsis sp. SAG 2025]MDV2996735.1 hypothetical protein [Chroococcidiopsis sp. SAG 2025]